MVSQALSEKCGKSFELQINSDTHETYLIFTSPIFTPENEIIAVLILFQPSEYKLNPIIKIWGQIFESVESVIISERDCIPFLNNPIFDNGSYWDTKRPFQSKVTSFFSNAFLTDSLIIYTNRNGKDVLGFVSKIQGMPWYLVTKTDKSQIFNILTTKLLTISGISLLLFLLLTSVLIYYYNKSQKDIYRSLYISNLELLKSQNKIVEHEKILSSIYNAAAEVILTIELPERRITHTNNAIEQIFGWKPAEVIGNSTAIFFPDDKAWERTGLIMQDAIKNKQVFCHTERKLVNKNKQPIYCDVHTSFIYQNDIAVKAVSVYHDITEIKQLIDELTDARAQAERNEKYKTMLLADIAHEVRSPLNGVLGFSELLLMKPDIPKEKRIYYLEIIKKTGDRMSETINDIMELSRIEAGATDLKISSVNLYQMTDYFYAFFKPEAECKGLELRLHNRLKTHKCFVKTDQGKLESIISNLLKNAIKYTSKGFVELEVEMDDAKLIYTIRDTGPGISPEQQEIIFNRFVQVDRTPAGRYDGLGIGLSIVKSYSDMIGGSITVKSVEGQGSEFCFVLPIAPFCPMHPQKKR